MRHEGAARERELSLLVFRRFPPSDALCEGLRNRLIDHPPDASDLIVAGKGQLVVRRVVLVEMGQREREQRKGVPPEAHR